MRKPLVSPAPLLTRINVTPIIDVALVLVIILLITAPMMSMADLELVLPAAHSRDSEQSGRVNITLGRTGEVAVDDQVLASIEDIPAALQSRLKDQGSRESVVVVRADSGLPHAMVRQVMDLARAGGATQLGIATQQAGGN